MVKPGTGRQLLYLITTTRRLANPAHISILDLSDDLAHLWQNGQLLTEARHEVHRLGVAGRSNLDISSAYCMRSTRRRSSLQSHRKTQPAQLKTQKTREYTGKLDAVQLRGRQLLCKYHSRGCLFLSTYWCVRHTDSMTDTKFEHLRYRKVDMSRFKRNVDHPDTSPCIVPIFGLLAPSQTRRKRERPPALTMPLVPLKVRYWSCPVLVFSAQTLVCRSCKTCRS